VTLGELKEELGRLALGDDTPVVIHVEPVAGQMLVQVRGLQVSYDNEMAVIAVIVPGEML
jgi:hypothetical protein